MPLSREGLLAEVASHAPDPDGGGARVRFLSFLREAKDPFTRENAGHVTASAIIMRSAGDSVLLRYHRKLGRWLQPGGHVEPEDDSAFATAVREAREETGIDRFVAYPSDGRVLDLDVHDIPPWKGEPPHVHYDVRYLLIAPEGAPDSERHRTRWFPRADLETAATEESLARAVRKAIVWVDSAGGSLTAAEVNSSE